MIYSSTHSDVYLLYLIFRKKQKVKKPKTHPNTKQGYLITMQIAQNVPTIVLKNTKKYIFFYVM